MVAFCQTFLQLWSLIIVTHLFLGNRTRRPIVIVDSLISTAPTKGKSREPAYAQAQYVIIAISVVGPLIWNGLPSQLRIFPRALSPAFFSQLKTPLFSRAGVGSASE